MAIRKSVTASHDGLTAAHDELITLHVNESAVREELDNFLLMEPQLQEELKTS